MSNSETTPDDIFAYTSRGFILVTTITLLSYDLIITFDREVEYVWRQPWTLGKFLFLVNRYLPFVDTGLVINLISTATSVEVCHEGYSAVDCLLGIGVLISEVILVLRTYALWDRKRAVLVVLIFLILFASGTLVYSVIAATKTLEFDAHHTSHLFNKGGCRILIGRNIGTPKFYVVILLSETVILILTAIKFTQHRGTRSPWVIQLYQNGLMFYIYVLLITIMNVCVSTRSKTPNHRNIFTNLQRVLHSICCNRVFLDLQNPNKRYITGFYNHQLSVEQSQRRHSQILTTVISDSYDIENAATDASPDINIAER